MLISQAFAASEAVAPTVAPAVADATGAIAAAPSTGQAFMTNMGLIAGMFVLFYVLLIRPQQKRLKAQQAMLMTLKVGDRVITGGGFVGHITQVLNDQEVVVDLGNNMKVTALRFTLTASTPAEPAKAA